MSALVGFSAGTDTHLRSLLSLDGVPRAREAELVMRLAGALHEVRVLEPLLAQRALEQRGRRGRRRLRALRGLRRRHRRRRRHVPRARRPPPAVRACRTGGQCLATVCRLHRAYIVDRKTIRPSLRSVPVRERKQQTAADG